VVETLHNKQQSTYSTAISSVNATKLHSSTPYLVTLTSDLWPVLNANRSSYRYYWSLYALSLKCVECSESLAF